MLDKSRYRGRAFFGWRRGSNGVLRENPAERILIIATEPYPIRGLVRALCRAGFSVARVPGYREAVLSLAVMKPAMIILRHASDESPKLCRYRRTLTTVEG